MPIGVAQQQQQQQHQHRLQQLSPHQYSGLPHSSADMDDLSVSDSDVDGVGEVDGFGSRGLLSDGPGTSRSLTAIFAGRQLLTFCQLAMMIAAAFVAGAAIAGGAVYAWKENNADINRAANGRVALNQGAMLTSAVTVPGPAPNHDDDNDGADTTLTPTLTLTGAAPSSTAGAGGVSLVGGSVPPLADGYRAAFYHGPQHLVRYPGTIPYLSEHAPFCHYERPSDAPAPTASSLLACINGARASYQTNPLQSSQLPCNRRRKVYDTFRYNDEDELLETRLEENFDVVDYFVVVESPMAFTGIRKEMAFAAAVAAGKYAKWMAKIIHVTCDLSHIVTPDDNEKNHFRGWAREFATTDCVLFGLGQAGPDDIVLYGDTDEIPRPDLLSALQMCSVEMGVLTETPAHPQALRLSGPRFVGNWKWQHYPGFPAQWTGSTIIVRQSLVHRAGGSFRGLGQLPVMAVIADGLWHCSWCFFGRMEKLHNKLDMWSEQGESVAIRSKLADPNWKNWLEDCGASDEAPRCTLWTRVDQLPKFVQNHPERYRDKGYAS